MYYTVYQRTDSPESSKRDLFWEAKSLSVRNDLVQTEQFHSNMFKDQKRCSVQWISFYFLLFVVY